MSAKAETIAAFVERFYHDTRQSYGSITSIFGIPIRDVLEVKHLADEENLTVKQLVEQYRLLRYGHDYKQRAAWRKHFGVLAELAEGRL